MNVGFANSFSLFPLPLHFHFILLTTNLLHMGVIFDIKRFATHDGPGIRTTVFMKGCALRCIWCHNPESFSLQPETICKKQKVGNQIFEHEETIGKNWSVEELFNELIKDQLYWKNSGGGVTLSGGEPLFQKEFTLNLLQKLKQQNIHTTLDTSGFATPNCFTSVLPFTDLVLFDIKLLDEENHKLYTRQSNAIILKNFDTLIKSGIPLHVRIPIIPFVNNKQEFINHMLAFLEPYKGKIKCINLLPFHNSATHKYKQQYIDYAFENNEPLNEQTLQPFKNEFEKKGFTVQIGG